MLWPLFVFLYYCILAVISPSPTFSKPHYPFALHQHRRKHFPYRQGINIFVSIPIQLHWHQPFQNRTIPCHALNLPPLSKGGGLTARHNLLPCCVLLAICPHFYITNFSAVKTEGLLYTTNPSKTAISLENRHHPCLLMNALPVSHPSETLGVHFRHPCLACPSRCT